MLQTGKVGWKTSVIIWITGERNSGKTTLAREMCEKMGAINLDGDDMRASISKDLGFSNEERLENNTRIALLAKVLEGQGFDVIVSTICPDVLGIRKDVRDITGCRFIHL